MEVTPKYVSPRSMWVSKLTLRCITIVFGVIAISLAATDVYFGLVVMVAPVSFTTFDFASLSFRQARPNQTCVFRLLYRFVGVLQNLSASLNAVATEAFIPEPMWAWTSSSGWA